MKTPKFTQAHWDWLEENNSYLYIHNYDGRLSIEVSKLRQHYQQQAKHEKTFGMKFDKNKKITNI